MFPDLYPREKKPGLQREAIPGANLVYVYQRSRDSALEMDISQDHLAYRYNYERLVFSVCDGATGSFAGDFAARFLGQHLIEWFWSLQAMPKLEHQLVDPLTEQLRIWTDVASREVGQLEVEYQSPFHGDAIEDLRAQGSQTMFVAGLLDLKTFELALAWLGDTKFIIWGGAKDAIHEQGTVSDQTRWSTRDGVMGGRPQARIGTLPTASQLTVFTDGVNLDRRTLKELGLDKALEDAVTAYQSDDITILNVTSVKNRLSGITASSGSPSQTSQLLLEQEIARQLDEIASLQAETTRLRATISAYESGAHRQVQTLQSHLADLQLQRDNLQRQLSSNQTLFAATEKSLLDEIRHREEMQRELVQEVGDLKVQISEMSSSGATAETYLREQLEEQQREIESLKESLRSGGDDTTELLEELSSTKDELSSVEQTSLQLQDQLANLKETLARRMSVLRLVIGYSGLATVALALLILLNPFGAVEAPGAVPLSPNSVDSITIVVTAVTDDGAILTPLTTESPMELQPTEEPPTLTITQDVATPTQPVTPSIIGTPDYTGCGPDNKDDARCISEDGIYWLYEVQQGDGLFLIARMYGLDDHQVIVDDNDLLGVSIQPGQILRIRIP